ncbi:ABC transporter ATP-binding protein [Bordetella sp. BOR01]|uniref:ABC transporter ATP-binding protein n=1 Tax=Bordetella sp. BOR01 TaxID=2854779 RepID=UPI001C4562F3|nr:ABC transporter ATP-binding protein [Bordetella sp. BOR01]MBV7482151.1 ABC transporter ATP-binding protein [Bordetella sp. BOR01]
MPALEAKDIVVRYGPLEAVRKASFTIGDGEIVALIGSNGAGKSTTLKSLMGLMRLASGELLLDGRQISGTGAAQRVRMGIALAPEGRRLFPRMTVWENLQIGAHTVSDVARKRNAQELVCSLFPIVAQRRRQQAGSLSGGEQQMVAIGRALMACPAILMLDEPSLGIAPKIVAEIGASIGRLNRETGISVLLVEQNAGLALRLARRAYVFEQGAIIRSGAGQELLNDPFVRKAYLGV